VLDALGIDPPEGLVEVEFSRWRSQEIDLPGGGLLINDAWNANPVAMRAALDHLRDRANGRRTVAILGDMAELGDEAPRFHEEIGAARNGLDLVIGVGELARGYAPDVWAPNAAEAIDLAREYVRPGDAVLVKGSRSVGLEVVAEALS
jgi:UDP-N-acetylmuramoyl-tripeptide--D-alanyl-D-alanine ligase